MLKSIGSRPNNFEQSLDKGLKRADFLANRQSAMPSRRRTILAIVCFSWTNPSGTWYDLSQAEVCDTSGNGTGVFAYVNTAQALMTYRPSIFGNVVWECEIINYGTPLTPTVHPSGYGPLNYSTNAPILIPKFPRYDIGAGSICNYLLATSGNTASPTISMSFGAKTTTLGGTAYSNVLPAIGSIDAQAVITNARYSWFKSYYLAGPPSGLPSAYFVPQAMPDVGDTTVRANAQNVTLGSQKMEHLEIFRLVVTNAASTSGTDNGIAATIYDVYYRNLGSSLTILASSGLSVGYSINSTVIAGSLTESSQNGGVGGGVYFSGAFTIGTTSIVVSPAFSSDKRCTFTVSAAHISSGNLIVMAVGGLI